MMSSVATSEEKKTEEGTRMSPPEPESNPVAGADRPEAQTLTPAMTKRVSDILTKRTIYY
jgi:hypothetical protein